MIIQSFALPQSSSRFGSNRDTTVPKRVLVKSAHLRRKKLNPKPPKPRSLGSLTLSPDHGVQRKEYCIAGFDKKPNVRV